MDYRALAELRHQIRTFLVFSEREARSAGLEPQKHQLLLAVKGLPEGQRPIIGVLAGRLQLRHNTVVGLVDRLAAENLVRRRPGEHDRREILVTITPKGERLLQKLTIAHRAELEVRGPDLATALEKLLGSSRATAARGRRVT